MADDWSELVWSDEINLQMMAKLQKRLLPGEAGGRSAQEHHAAGHAEEHEFLEADHRVS